MPRRTDDGSSSHLLLALRQRCQGQLQPRPGTASLRDSLMPCLHDPSSRSLLDDGKLGINIASTHWLSAQLDYCQYALGQGEPTHVRRCSGISLRTLSSSSRSMSTKPTSSTAPSSALPSASATPLRQSSTLPHGSTTMLRP